MSKTAKLSPRSRVLRRLPLLRWALEHTTRFAATNAPHRPLPHKLQPGNTTNPRSRREWSASSFHATSLKRNDKVAGPADQLQRRRTNPGDVVVVRDKGRTILVAATRGPFSSAASILAVGRREAGRAIKAPGTGTTPVTSGSGSLRSRDAGTRGRPGLGGRYGRSHSSARTANALGAHVYNVPRREARRVTIESPLSKVAAMIGTIHTYSPKSPGHTGYPSRIRNQDQRAASLSVERRPGSRDTSTNEAGGVAGGSIFLDGYKLGSWIVNHIERTMASANRSHGYLSAEDDVLTRLYTTGSSPG